MSNSADTSKKQTIPDGHEKYVLAILFIVYIFNFADRYILVAVQSAIIEELKLSDDQMGMLTGLAFALFYTFVGIPIARLADRKARTTIMAIGLTLWSGLTAASGLARNFIHILLARVGVAVGESTATPCAHSLISDYFPPEKRGKAIGLYSIGANFGMLLGMMAGGLILKYLGWRYAFFIVGMPGIVLALIVKFTIKEPPRGFSDITKTDKLENLPLKETLKYLFSLKSFRHLCAAGSIAALTGFGVMTWANVFFMRTHNMPVEVSNNILGIVIGIVGGLSTFLGGFLVDKLSKRSRKWAMWISAIGMGGMVPFLLLFLLTPDKNIAIVGITLTFLVGLFYFAPTFSTVQGLARPDMRALASAIFLFLINLIGMGLGPYIVGLLSRLLKPEYGIDSLRYAMLIISAGTIWATFHYLMAARTLPEDLDKAIQ